MKIDIATLIPCLFMTLSFWAQQVSVMTYNIRVDFGGDGENSWEFRRDFLAGQINYNNPDFLGTQEGKYHQLQYLDSLMTHHSWFGMSRDNSKTDGEFSAIFYNTDTFRLIEENTFWLSETPDIPSKGWDGAYPRICTYGLFEDKISGTRLYVFNTHLDHIGELARSNGVKLILERIKSVNKTKLPVILTGDFNSEMTSEAYRTMVSQLSDTRTVSRQKPFGPSGTFNGFKFNEPVKLLIDYNLYRPESRFGNLRCSVIRATASIRRIICPFVYKSISNEETAASTTSFVGSRLQFSIFSDRNSAKDSTKKIEKEADSIHVTEKTLTIWAT